MGRWQIPRRTMLKGMGAAMALPWLEAMLPRLARAAATPETVPPNRLAILFVPNGVQIPDWTPTGEGAEYEMSPILSALERHRKDFSVLSGLTQNWARDHGDGGGDHARSAAVFLTGCHPYKTDGANLRAGISVDQVAALRLARETALPSLELGCDKGSQSGNCDSGYSCAYSANISWRSPTTPMIKEVNPRIVFERLFRGERLDETAEARDRRIRYRKSILDFVRDDANRLQRQLGQTDRRKLGEYLEGVREIELRIERAEQFAAKELPHMDRPEGIPPEYADHIRLMCDLMALAFEADLTRVCTFMIANEGSNRSYNFIDVPDGHHDLTHHGGDQEKQRKIAKINRFHLEQFAYLLERMKSIREGEGTLLDHSMVVYGSGIGDGNRHNHDDLPILLAGRGCGTLAPGRHVRYPNETPLNNLWLALLDRMGVEVDSLGDSTGRLGSLMG
jgi:hypothetical protein